MNLPPRLPYTLMIWKILDRNPIFLPQLLTISHYFNASIRQIGTWDLIELSVIGERRSSFKHNSILFYDSQDKSLKVNKWE
jgi:hypothetical protein